MKITQLEPADALSGNERVAIVQGGRAKRASIAAIADGVRDIIGSIEKGDPGADTGPVGILAAIPGITIPAGNDGFQVSGFDVVGDEGAGTTYVHDASIFAADPPFSIIDQAGRGFRRVESLAANDGATRVGFKQFGANALDQTMADKLQRIVHVDDYRLAPDADDTNAFERAVAAIVATGGEILLDPKKRYLVSGSITIASTKPITIRGGGFGQVYDATGPGIAYTAAINSVFRVQSPTASRSEAGGVHFVGVSFYDASYNAGGLTPGAPGTNTIANAVLDLWDAPLSCVENCQFHYVEGSAIKTDFAAQTSIKGCRIRYSGVAGKKVVHLGATDASYASQAVTVTDCRIEVCYGDAYLYTAALAQSVTVSHCQFEAATTEYPASSVPFVDTSCDGFNMVGCGINRNLAQAVILRAGRGIIFGNAFATGAAATETISLLASRYVLVGNAFADTRTGVSLRVVGINNVISANRFYQSGGVSLEGAGNSFNGNTIDTPSMTGGGYALVLADWCRGSDNFLTSPGVAPAVNGVALYGNQAIFTGNNCRDWAGKTFIRVESTTAVFSANTHDGVGTFATQAGTLASAASAATLNLPYGFSAVTVTGATNITAITAGTEWTGRVMTLIFAGALTVVDGGNLKLGGDFTATADDTLTLACDGFNWFEVARGVN